MTVKGDALIYSTNVQLMLSGGVGACLLQKFGNDFQSDLYRQLDSSGRKLAEVGEIFQTELSDASWRLVLHTIATDPMYHTDPEVVRSLVARSFETCSERKDITSIIMSPLGAGYGDLEMDTFLQIVTEESLRYEDSSITSLTICCDFELSFRDLVCTASTLGTEWKSG
ncbi:macro domain-containing protein [Verrucomicrobiaceae bacterium N1E253]|uniref:Macro domain-containing protein n=2 Tax=Oceaniferula marina TaxID=2748318 RepID=A0A851GSL2_9BACT|nr:macro domain-containing protein [Oceaniferula marina]